MDKPKWGTCGGLCDGTKPCRWSMYQNDNEWYCAYYPKVSGPYTPQHTCSKWKPPEGKVCGNCECAALLMEEDLFCMQDGTCTHEHDTCDAWRWLGPKREEDNDD